MKKSSVFSRVQRRVALLLAVCLLLAALPVGGVTADTAADVRLSVAVGEVSATAGESVQVPVTFSHDTAYALTSGSVTVTYDASMLTPVVPCNAAGEPDWELAAGEALQYALCQVDDSVAGRLVISFVTAATLTASEGVLMELPFRAAPDAAGRQPLAVSVGSDITAVRREDHAAAQVQVDQTQAGAVWLSAAADTALLGDANGDGKVSTADAALVLQFAAELLGEDALAMAVADVNGDGKVTTADAALILQYAAEVIDRFPTGGSTAPTSTVTQPSDQTTDTSVTEPTTSAIAPTTSATQPTTTAAPTTKATYPAFDDTSRDPQVGEINTGYAFLDPNQVGDKEGAVENNIFKKFLLCQEDNAQLPYSISLYVSRGQKAVTALVPSGVDLTSLVPRFSYDGTVTLYGREIHSGVDALDFSQKFQLELTDAAGRKNTVVVKVMAIRTGLPSFTATTEDLQPVPHDKSAKVTTFTLGGGDKTSCFYAPDEVLTMTGELKGRGNTSWGQEKKSYTVKLDKKATLLDMDKSKDWVLVAAHEDFSQLRNLMGQYLGELAGVTYTLKMRPVDFWYNGAYWGTYMLAQKIEIESTRVDITKYTAGCGVGQTGFLLEFDGHVCEGDFEAHREEYRIDVGEGYEVYYNPVSDELFFPLTIGGKWLTIKKPSYTKYLINDTAQIRYVYDYVYAAMKALREHRSYEEVCRYIDVESFTNWYIVEEFMNNCDSSFHSSCYMTLDVGGRLQMGPVWDFDRSSDNCDYWNAENKPDSLRKSGAAWFVYLYGDGDEKSGYDEARAVLKERWRAFYNATATIGQTLDEWVSVIDDSVALNFKRWNVLGAEEDGNRNKPVGSNTEAVLTATTYEGQVAILRNYFLKRRVDMNRSINAL